MIADRLRTCELLRCATEVLYPARLQKTYKEASKSPFGVLPRFRGRLS